MISTNLIPAARLAGKRRLARMRIWIRLCLTYALVLAVTVCLYRATWRTGNGAVTDELEVIRWKTANSTRSIDRLRGELCEARTALEAGRAMGDQPDWSILLALFARQLGDDIVLDECKLRLLDVDRPGTGTGAASSNDSANGIRPQQKRYRLSLSGFGRTQTAVSRFVLRLERIELLKQVRLTRSDRQAFLAGKAVAFRIECSI